MGKKVHKAKSAKLGGSLPARKTGSPDPADEAALFALFNENRYPEAATLALSMTVRFPRYGVGWKILGVAFRAMGWSGDALAPMQKAVELLPRDAAAHSNLGAALNDLGRLSEAEASYRRATELQPGLFVAHSNLGNTLWEQGRLQEAEASCRRALAIKADYAEALNNLGLSLMGQGRMAEAETSFRRALEIKPDYAEARGNLGATLRDMGRIDEAETCYRSAIAARPDYVNAFNSLALLLNAQGRPIEAFNLISESLGIKETAEAKRIFTSIVKSLRFKSDNNSIRSALVRALTEPWERPNQLASISTDFIKLNREIRECMERAADAWPRRLPAKELFGSSGLATLGADELLCTLLGSTILCDVGMERFLTMARHALLEVATGKTGPSDTADGSLIFYSALAQQCFINEYVYACNDSERQEAVNLRDSLATALEKGTDVPLLWLVAVAAYFPLHSLPLATRLLNTSLPETVAALLARQVCEPEEERRLRASLPRLTEIEDGISILVRSQYEENPYPRWIKAAPAETSRSIVGYLCQKYPLSSPRHHAKSEGIDVLIAGCGTGRTAIETAHQFANARVLAVDLSLSSLCYAKRKAQELGLVSIEFAQADLLKMASFPRRFDFIESTGVLHHLADPFAGWQVLLSLLRPEGGFMKLGFYSELARRDIVKARAFIADRGYGATADGIRRCRQELMDMDSDPGFGTIMKSPDFFGTSTCRDLLFHVQEHRTTLTGIDAFLRKNDLAFLGFEIDDAAIHAYRQRFPNDRAATNLEQWQIFENENPSTFFGMYQFWIQKAG